VIYTGKEWKEYRCQMVCDSILTLRLISQGPSCTDSSKCYGFLIMEKKGEKKIITLQV